MVIDRHVHASRCEDLHCCFELVLVVHWVDPKLFFVARRVAGWFEAHEGHVDDEGEVPIYVFREFRLRQVGYTQQAVYSHTGTEILAAG